MSPIRSTIFMDGILKDCGPMKQILHVGYKNVQGVEISEMLIVWLEKTANNLHRLYVTKC